MQNHLKLAQATDRHSPTAPEFSAANADPIRKTSTRNFRCDFLTGPDKRFYRRGPAAEYLRARVSDDAIGGHENAMNTLFGIHADVKIMCVSTNDFHDSNRIHYGTTKHNLTQDRSNQIHHLGDGHKVFRICCDIPEILSGPSKPAHFFGIVSNWFCLLSFGFVFVFSFGFCGLGRTLSLNFGRHRRDLSKWSGQNGLFEL